FPLQSQAFIFAFSAGILRRTPLTRRRVCRCSVSVVAHYRELFRPDKRKNIKTLSFAHFSGKTS
ncbi:hypothetical protein RCV39_23675, partial [Escherichia coli]|nr:hypothetical protein [Escherichia coli]